MPRPAGYELGVVRLNCDRPFEIGQHRLDFPFTPGPELRHRMHHIAPSIDTLGRLFLTRWFSAAYSCCSIEATAFSVISSCTANKSVAAGRNDLPKRGCQCSRRSTGSKHGDGRRPCARCPPGHSAHRGRLRPGEHPSVALVREGRIPGVNGKQRSLESPAMRSSTIRTDDAAGGRQLRRGVEQA